MNNQDLYDSFSQQAQMFTQNYNMVDDEMPSLSDMPGWMEDPTMRFSTFDDPLNPMQNFPDEAGYMTQDVSGLPYPVTQEFSQPTQNLAANTSNAAATLSNQQPLPQFAPPSLQALQQQQQQLYAQQSPQPPPPALSRRQGSDAVPIPRQYSAQATGPMSTTVILPDRPKPGRKPIPENDRDDRRRTQNRVAQRNFRDKRQQKLADTQKELEASKKSYEDHLGELRRDNARLTKQLAEMTGRASHLQTQLLSLQQRMNENEGKATHANMSSFSSDGSMPAPPMPNFRTRRFHGPSRDDPATLTPPLDMRLETDFTHYNIGRTAPFASMQSTPTLQGDNVFGSLNADTQEEVDNCGFCTDPGNCLCKSTRDSVSGPQAGNCAGCLEDPARAQACKQIARSAQPDVNMYDASMPSSSSHLASRISCEQLMDKATRQGHRPASVPELLGDRVQAYQSANGGYHVYEQEAAQALSTLGQSTRRAQQGSKKRSSKA